MAGRSVMLNGRRVTAYGPFKGSSANGGRETETIVKSDGSRTTMNYDAFKYAQSHGGKKPRDKDVDHKDGNKENHSSKNLQLMSHKKNVAKGNKERHHRKAKK